MTSPEDRASPDQGRWVEGAVVPGKGGAVRVVLLACRVFEALLPGLERVSYLDYGLHQVPRQLNATLQGRIHAVSEPSLIVLGYGLCGNGLHGIEAGIHTLLVPRMDDCIAMFLGSSAAYRAAEPGTYYLTKGWLEAGADPLSQYEDLLQRYDADTAQWVMDAQYRHYRRLVFVALQRAELTQYRPQAERVAAYCARWGMRYEERLGTMDLITQFAQAISAARRGQPLPAGEFILVPPGGTLTQADFLRVSGPCHA